jgi:hypothetical protein
MNDMRLNEKYYSEAAWARYSMLEDARAVAVRNRRATSSTHLPEALGIEQGQGHNLRFSDLVIMSAVNGRQPLLRSQAELTEQRSGLEKLRKKAHDMVEGSIDTWFEYSLLCVIFLNVLALVMASVRVNKPGEQW